MSSINGWYRRLFFALRECIGGVYSVTTQSFVELNIKRGQQFFFVDVTPSVAANGGVKEYLVRTTDPVVLKDRVYKTNGSDTDYEVFAGGDLVITNTGTPAIIRNPNGITPNVAITQGFEDPTYTGQGFLIDLDWIPGSVEVGGRNNGGFSESGFEKIIPGNTDFLVRFTNNSPDPIKLYYFITWYEGPIVPLGDETPVIPTDL